MYRQYTRTLAEELASERRRADAQTKRGDHLETACGLLLRLLERYSSPPLLTRHTDRGTVIFEYPKEGLDTFHRARRAVLQLMALAEQVVGRGGGSGGLAGAVIVPDIVFDAGDLAERAMRAGKREPPPAESAPHTPDAAEQETAPIEAESGPGRTWQEGAPMDLREFAITRDGQDALLAHGASWRVPCPRCGDTVFWLTAGMTEHPDALEMAERECRAARERHTRLRHGPAYEQ